MATPVNQDFETLSALPCPLCQGPLRSWMRVPGDCKKGQPNAHQDVYWCSSCSHGTVQPIPSPRQVEDFYRLPQYYTQGVSHFEPGLAMSLLDRLRLHIAWRLDRGEPTTAESVHRALNKQHCTIADLGCGGGQLAADLTKLGHQVVGVEVDPAAISRQHHGLFKVFAGTAEELPEEVKTQKFDCVVMCHVLEHCREPMKVLQNVRSILKDDGKFLCEVPNNAAAGLDHVGCAWEMFDVPRHLHFFTSQSLARACEAVGLKVEQTTFSNFARQFTNSWIDTERKLWNNLMNVSPQPSPLPIQNSRLYAWQLLAKTLFAPAHRKYDSVSVVAIPC